MDDTKYVAEKITLTCKGKWCLEQSNKGKTEQEKQLLWLRAVNEYDKLFTKEGKRRIN